MNIFIIFIYFLLFQNLSLIFSYLTPFQQQKIQLILKNPDTPEKIKIHIKKIIFVNYLPWIKKECNNFCYDNKELMTYVYYNSINKKALTNYKKEELLLDAYIGFSKALNNFNGNFSTIRIYSKNFIKHEIYKGITKSTKQMKYKSLLENSSNNYLYNQKMQLKMNEDFQNEIKSLNDIIIKSNILTNKEIELLHYRYDLSTMKKLRTIRNVSNLMKISEETYRKKYKKIIFKIKDFL